MSQIKTLILLTLVVFISGCGSDLPTTIPVSGKITIGGNPPPTGGQIYFQHTKAADGFSLRPASAPFDADGSYKVGAFQGAEGLVPGEYTIRIECWKTAPNMETGVTGESHVPETFTESLSVPVGSDAITHNLDVPAR